MKISDNYDFSAYDVNIQQFTENVRYILNFGLYDVKYENGSIPTYRAAVNEHPLLLMKYGATARLYVGDSNATNSWWYANLTEL